MISKVDVQTVEYSEKYNIFATPIISNWAPTADQWLVNKTCQKALKFKIPSEKGEFESLKNGVQPIFQGSLEQRGWTFNGRIIFIFKLAALVGFIISPKNSRAGQSNSGKRIQALFCQTFLTHFISDASKNVHKKSRKASRSSTKNDSKESRKIDQQATAASTLVSSSVSLQITSFEDATSANVKENAWKISDATEAHIHSGQNARNASVEKCQFFALNTAKNSKKPNQAYHRVLKIKEPKHASSDET